MDISGRSARQLLELHAKIEKELGERKILRNANNPVGDLAEFLFRTAFPDWKLEHSSKAHYDAKGETDGKLYQIKCRRIIGNSSQNSSRQLSAIRGLEQAHSHFLAGLLLKEDYSIYKAALIPHSVLLSLFEARKHISFQKHTNSHRFMLVDEIWEVSGVQDVTAQLQSVWD